MVAIAIKIFLLKIDFIFIVYSFKLNIWNRSCFYRNSIFAETLHAALLINDKSRSKLVRNIIPRYMKDICISGGI